MLTFQILDGGESFYRPLEARPLTIGRGASCDIRLQEEGVAEQHVQVVPSGDGDDLSYRLVVAESAPPVQVNGNETRDVELVLGDRIEVGRAVLLLGQQVRRPATATDVLNQTSMRRATSRYRGDGTRKLLIGTVVAAAAVLAFMVWQWSGQASIYLPHNEKDIARRARIRGKFDEARDIAQTLRNNWAQNDPRKLALVEELERQIEETESAYTQLRQEIRRDVLKKTKAEQLARIRELKTHGLSQGTREAAHLIHGRLEEFRQSDRAEAIARLPSVIPPADDTQKEQKAVPAAPKRPAWLDARLADVRKLQEDGRHAQALEMLRQALPDVPIEYASPVRDLLDDVRQATRKEMVGLVARARGLRQQGKLTEAVELLRGEVIRFPTHGPLSQLYATLTGFEADLELSRTAPRRLRVAAAKRGPKRPATRDPVEPRSVQTTRSDVDQADQFVQSLMQVEAAETAGDLRLAAQRVGSAAAAFKSRPRFAAVLDGRAADLVCLIKMSEQAQRHFKPELNLVMRLSDGRTLPVRGIKDGRLTCGTGADSQEFGWLSVPPAEVERMFRAMQMPDAGFLGVAVLLYRDGQAKKAEELLARLLKKDKKLADDINGVVARGRDEKAGEEGYDLVNGEFVARRFLRVEKLARKLERRLNQLARRDDAARDKALAEMLTSGGAATDAVTMALREAQRKTIARIARSPFRKGYDKVAKVRQELDRARADALALIFDRRKYFYPYRPPAVSATKASEYGPVQQEVSRRVAAVQKIWLRDKTRVTVPEALRKDLGFLAWIDESLVGLDESVGNRSQQIAWIDTLPPVKVLTVSNFCKTAQERRRFLLHLRIEGLNEILAEKHLSEGEQSQVNITNSYRLMMGRTLLAINPKIHAAARGHAVEMDRLGYFGHFSPDQERRTPFLRMRLEGYKYGVSENIGSTPSAAGVHRGWLRSSGHHRNILMPSHTEFAVGNMRGVWVQNFGMGREFESDKDFPPPDER